MDSINYTSKIFLTGKGKDLDALNRLKASRDKPSIIDVFLAQQRELIKINFPRKVLSTKDINSIQKEWNDGIDTNFSGCWVYYSWKNTLVHLLDPEDFIKVRTSRNVYKITPKEQEFLQNCSVGIIGLSVGHNVALTLAMERSVGEMRLADFDDLELSNLNRIKTSLLNTGLPKVVIAAREIAEIDPFIKVKCFTSGIDEHNLDQFLTEEGNLNVLVEECDSLNIKIIARKRAKDLGIPVLMETSDRGMLDVERFDLEPKRPILHGLIEHLDLNIVKGLKSSEEKVPYLMPMVGIETMSTRLKASALEVGQSIGTWPQLASSVMLGGAVLSDTYRRIVLGENVTSGRYIIDPSEIIVNNTSKSKSKSTNKSLKKELSVDEMRNIVESLSLPIKETIPKNVIESVVEASGMAPSGGNSQPWKWYVSNGYIHLFLDVSLSDSFMDYENSASYIALGAALENARIQALSLGYVIATNYFPLTNNEQLVASCYFNRSKSQSETLANQIPLRHSNRSKGTDLKITSDEVMKLKNVCSEFKQIKTEIVKDKNLIKEIAEIISIGDWLRIMNYDSHRDFIDEEMRWTKEEALKKRDGIFVEELSLSPSDLAGLHLIKDKKVIEFMNEQKTGHGLKSISSRLVNSSQILLYGFTKDFTKESFLHGGELLERLWLTCTKMNIGFQVLNVPLAFLLRAKNDDLDEVSDYFKDDIKIIKHRLDNIFPEYSTSTDLFIIRLFKTKRVGPSSFRRELKDILFHG